MTSKKAQPFIISRSSSKASMSGVSKTSSIIIDDNTTSLSLKKQDSFITSQNKLLLQQTSFKNIYTMFNTDKKALPELIEKYNKLNLEYREEQYSQMSDAFLTKLAQDKTIPKDFRAKFPIQAILTAIVKIFMLNEYEIAVFACMLDYCKWKMDEVIFPSEEEYLKEFPILVGMEITPECKKFIIYLLILTFSLKQYLNEKNDVDLLQAYCEKICDNFQVLFNRFTRVAMIKFNYSAPEINRKFKALSERSVADQSNLPKDYNTIADSIMTLTVPYVKPQNGREENMSKSIKLMQPIPTRSPQEFLNKGTVFYDIPAASPFELKTPVYLDKPEKGDFGLGQFEEIPDFFRLSSMMSRQPSFTNAFNGYGLFPMKRPVSSEIYEDSNRKKVKADENQTSTPRLVRGDSNWKKVDIDKMSEDDLFLFLPPLSQKNSLVSNPDLDAPPMSKNNSFISYFLDK